MIPRLRRALLLFAMLCLVGAQTAAFAHGISHLGVDAPPTAAAAGAHATSFTADHLEGFCLECLAFAQVTGGAHGTPAQPAFAAPSATALVVPLAQHLPARAFDAFDARGPPRLPTH